MQAKMSTKKKHQMSWAQQSLNPKLVPIEKVGMHIFTVWSAPFLVYVGHV